MVPYRETPTERMAHLEDEVVIRLNNAAAPWAAEAVGVAAFELVDDRAIASNDAAAVGRRAAVLGHGSQSTFTPCSDVLVRLAALQERVGRAPLDVAPHVLVLVFVVLVLLF